MRWTIRKKMILTVIAVALLPFLLGFIIIEGSLIETIEETTENDLLPAFDKVDAQRSLFMKSVKDQIRTNEDGLTAERIKYFDTTNFSKLYGYYIEVDGVEIYRSSLLQGVGVFQSEDYENDIVIGEDHEDVLGVFDRSEVLTLDHTYVIYTVYNYQTVSGAILKYIGFLVIGAVSIFAIIAFLLIVWVFKHMRSSLNQLHDMTHNIIGGDLSTKIPYNQKDEFKGIADMIDQLRSDLHESNLENEHLEAERERMLVNITHDIKTPITAIKGCSQMLADGLVKEENKKKEYLDIILSRSHVIEHMVDDLKEVIKYDMGTIKLNRVDVNLGYFLEDCIDDFKINHEDQNFEINFDKSNIEQHVSMDPNLLQRVFKNIIGNALKYNRERKINIGIATYSMGNTIRFKISDNGVGVPDESLDKLFDRLYRVDSSRNSSIEGSGVGLAICKEIIEAHGGSIWAENSDEKFNILFSIPMNGGK